MVLTIVVFLIVLSILILIHEFGHYLVGRWAGIGVMEFALGLPFTKPLISKKRKDGMKLSLYPVLFGGFVSLLGEEPDQQRDGIRGAYFSKVNVWKRIAVVVAGVTMNLLSAIIAFYLFLVLAGFKVVLPKYTNFSFASPTQEAVVVTAVLKNTPGERAGLSVGDVILNADGQNLKSLTDFQNYVHAKSGDQIDFVVADSELNNQHMVSLIPRTAPPKGEGPIGIGIADALVVDYQLPTDKLLSGLNYTRDMLGYNLNVVSFFFSQAIKTHNAAPVADSVSGPVGIASAVGTILSLGPSQATIQLINPLGLLSLSLAFMNILPFPALDGGRAFFLLIEAFTGKKLSPEKENKINQIGMAFLLGLIILISISDVLKMIPH